MATQFDTSVEIRKFDEKNFSLWKEMMQDVPIIRRQVDLTKQQTIRMLFELSSQWINFEEEVKVVPSFQVCRQVRRSSARHSPTAI